jgi:hypothetical protein
VTTFSVVFSWTLLRTRESHDQSIRNRPSVSPVWQYQNCAGLQSQIDDLMKHKFMKDEERLKKCEAMLSTVDSCPLKVRHPPSGIEFGMGCIMCRDGDTKEANAKAALKAKRDDVVKRKRLKQLFCHLRGVDYESGGDDDPEHDDDDDDAAAAGKVFAYKSDFDGQGVMHWLGTLNGTRAWQNPCTDGFVRVLTSGLMPDSEPTAETLGRFENQSINHARF